uniref:Insulin n=1 Tax=Neogobius melanostomus TaxID=47308 RepID=A0A8C6SLK0_9GOBI
MAVSWLQSACLLVLVAALCPGTEGFTTQHLCGPHLVDALNMVCADRGFYYNPQRDTHPGISKTKKAFVKLEPIFLLTVQHSERRGIVQECCENPCSLLNLEKYCN